MTVCGILGLVAHTPTSDCLRDTRISRLHPRVTCLRDTRISCPSMHSSVFVLTLSCYLEIYKQVKYIYEKSATCLGAGIHRHFVLYGLMEFLRRRFVPLHVSVCWFILLILTSFHFLMHSLTQLLRCFHSFDRHFSADEVLQLLERFYNLEMLVSNLLNSFSCSIFLCSFIL